MSLLGDIRDAIQDVWSDNWPHGTTYLVLWHSNAAQATPDAGSVSHWLHNEVQFGVDYIRGYGTGRLANERVQQGSVIVRVFTEHGAADGEDTTLSLLSDAVAAFRSRRDGPLSFIGDITGLDDGGTEDGAWWIRSAVISWEYRHIG